MEVLDLDVLRPQKRIVKLGGHEIDVSYIPLGITFDVDEVIKELAPLNGVDLQKGGEPARKALKLACKLCALFCSVKYPELDEEWFQTQATPEQVIAFSDVVKDTLFRSYEGVEEYSGNQEAAKTIAH